MFATNGGRALIGLRPILGLGLIGFFEKLSCERGNLSILRTDGGHIETQCELKQTKHYRTKPSENQNHITFILKFWAGGH